MGNSQSSDAPKSPASTSTPSRDVRRRGGGGGGGGGSGGVGGSERGREASPYNGTPPRSSAAGRSLSHAKASTPPSTSTSTTTTTTSPAPHSSTTTNSASPSHTRVRSITTSAAHTTLSPSSSSATGSMGNSESREKRPPSRSNTLPPTDKSPPPQPTTAATTTTAALPIHVPAQPPPPPQDVLIQDAYNSPPINSPLVGYSASDFSRPPRLPLPIERDPEPVSPLASPLDGPNPLEAIDDVDLAHRPGSLSSTTLDDDEVADIDTFTLDSNPYSQKVLTTLEWRGQGKTVYVTGTFAHWEKKFKMTKVQDADGKSVFTLTAPLPTGTHHIKFLVDGEMALSDQYPTTVDYTASLVNYVEIAAPMPAPDAQPPAPAEPMPIPGAPTSETSSERTAKYIPSRTEALAVANDEALGLAPLVEETAPKLPVSPAPVQQPQHQQSLEHREQAQRPSQKQQLPRPKYTSEIPDYLQDIDLYTTPDDDRFRRVTKATQNLPQPPSLPMFMSKSILNAATPHKDDASVLTMPNHTVLNHLATSSIRQGVLATSGTTRYKRKFLTTILYKPTSDTG